ncbi:hypothetical protein YC2023_059232 [Brassica napus]
MWSGGCSVELCCLSCSLAAWWSFFGCDKAVRSRRNRELVDKFHALLLKSCCSLLSNVDYGYFFRTYLSFTLN